jgi:predicted MPP superfamily phosphohydrolase
MRLYFSSIIIIAFIVLIDWWFDRYISKYNGRFAKILRWFNLFASVSFVAFFISIFLSSPVTADISGVNFYNHFFYAITWTMIWYIPRFVLMQLNLVSILTCSFFRNFRNKIFKPFNNILIITIMVLGLYGFFVGRVVLVEHRNVIENKALGKEFDGYRIVQLSDMHLGTMPHSIARWEKFAQRINALEPDLIVFTGDLVNNFWTETQGWDSVFSRLQAKDGKIAVMGNHDYGDYIPWKTRYDKELNHVKVTSFLQKTGFRVLENQHVPVIRNQDTLIIAGVENWGHPPFPRYGDLSKALEGLNGQQIVLLTHDPDHWEAEVLPSPNNIFLTLAGHTHGFQIGMRTQWLTFSPAAWRYKHWGGLYTVNDKNLYVNTGAGFIAFKGRIGMWPEVAVFDLKIGF